MRIIPVLDVKAGRAVRAVAGDRPHYGPLVSVLHPEPDPLALARALRDRFGLRELYLADLDALAGAPPALGLIGGLSDLGVHVWVDAGVRDRDDAAPLLAAGAGIVIVGLETVRGPGALGRLVGAVGPDRLAFSLDLRAGRPLIEPGADWGTADPLGLTERAIAAGLTRVLLLDLARVGTGRGIGSLDLLETLVGAHPGVSFLVGGGVAGPDDLPPLARTGASAVLVGSALHDGRLPAPPPAGAGPPYAV